LRGASILLGVVFCLGAGVFATEARAAAVLAIGKSGKSVAVSHDVPRKFQMNDRVCVVQASVDVVCGVVVRVTPKGAIVSLDTAYPNLSVGDPVRPVERPRAPAAEILNSVDPGPAGTPKTFNVSGGVAAGLNYFFPLLHLQLLVFDKLALGLEPLYMRASSDGAKLSAYGGYGTFNYYGAGHFQGLWIQAGVGMVAYSTVSVLGTKGEAKSLAFLGTVGWRGYWEGGLNIGLGAGLQYISDPKFTEVKINSVGALPLVMLDVGVSF